MLCSAVLLDTSLRNAEDYDMWIRIAAAFPIVKLEVPLWWYRVHGAKQRMRRCARRLPGSNNLAKTFAKPSPLSRRLLLKRKAYSYAAYAAAQNFSVIGAEVPALLRIVRSFVLWPFPYPRREVTTPLARPKKLIITCLRLLGLVAKAAPQMSSRTPSFTLARPAAAGRAQRERPHGTIGAITGRLLPRPECRLAGRHPEKFSLFCCNSRI